jgi:hypothetical protein
MTSIRPTSAGQNHAPDRVRNAEETLRLLATLPVPEDLVDRVQARLAATPPRSFLSGSYLFGRNGWMFSPIFSQGLRACAAAAIVLLVAGGGFVLYSHVQPSPTAKVIEMPARVGNSGGFSNANAMRTPDTLKGPVLVNPVVPDNQSAVAKDAQVFSVAAATDDAGRLGSSPVSVRGHFWWGKEGSMIFDSGYKAVLPLQYSDEFNSKHSFPEFVSKPRKSDVVTITGRLHSKPNGRLTLVADDIQFAENQR